MKTLNETSTALYHHGGPEKLNQAIAKIVTNLRTDRIATRSRDQAAVAITTIRDGVAAKRRCEATRARAKMNVNRKIPPEFAAGGVFDLAEIVRVGGQRGGSSEPDNRYDLLGQRAIERPTCFGSVDSGGRRLGDSRWRCGSISEKIP